MKEAVREARGGTRRLAPRVPFDLNQDFKVGQSFNRSPIHNILYGDRLGELDTTPLELDIHFTLIYRKSMILELPPQYRAGGVTC
jgi:hypothetical protein